ncbi:MAG: SH3 domain-containing protein [Motiliproteus sp.]
MIITTLKSNIRTSPKIVKGNVSHSLDQFSVLEIYGIREVDDFVWFKINDKKNEWVSEKTSAVIAPDSNSLYGLLNTKKLNVREGPSKDKSKIGSLVSGDLVKIVTILENGWFLIESVNANGFVHGNYIEVFNVGALQ